MSNHDAGHNAEVSRDQPTPNTHEPRDDETVDWYDVALEVEETRGEVHHTIQERFTVVAVTEAMACEEAQHLCKEKYGTTGRVAETVQLSETQVELRRGSA